MRTGTDEEGRTELHASAEPDAVGALVGVLHDAGIHTLTVTPPSLDDLFLEAYATPETERA